VSEASASGPHQLAAILTTTDAGHVVPEDFVERPRARGSDDGKPKDAATSAAFGSTTFAPSDTARCPTNMIDLPISRHHDGRTKAQRRGRPFRVAAPRNEV